MLVSFRWAFIAGTGSRSVTSWVRKENAYLSAPPQGGNAKTKSLEALELITRGLFEFDTIFNMSLGKRGSSIRRDSSSCTLIRFNEKTNRRAIEGQQRVVGAENAERLRKKLMRDRSKQEIDEGWTWRLMPNSPVAGRRLGFGHEPGKN